MAKKVSDSQVAGIKAHAEAKNKETIDKVKVSTAHRRKWTTDEYMCGFAPYGYLKSKTEKNRIVVDEATAGNVRLIYKLFLDGKGYTPIAKYLNEQGIMSPLMYLKSLGYQQNVYEKAITRQRRELEKVNRKFSELYGDYSEHLINESEYLTLKQQYLLKSEALKKEIDNLLVSQNLYSKNYKIDEDWENLINKYLKCRKLNKELADAFVDKVQVFEDGRISVNLVYDDCLEELLQVKNKREGDLYE